MKIFIPFMLTFVSSAPDLNKPKTWQPNGYTTVYRLFDSDTNIACYVTDTINGNTHSSSIACFSVKLPIAL